VLADEDHVSVDKFVAAVVSERIGDWSRLQARAARGSLEKFRQVLSKVPMTRRTRETSFRSFYAGSPLQSQMISRR
jgi:hypothetical protein